MKENVVLLEDLLKRGIRVEEETAFERSIFSNVYDNAKLAVESIIQANRDGRRSQYANAFYQDEEIPNVVSFIGRRGTGKTSSMLSFCKALDNYKGDFRFRDFSGLKFSEKADMADVCFFSLDYIDASVLEESENVFILVLANMLNYLEKVNEQSGDEVSYEYRMLLQQFENVYNDFLTIKDSRQYENEEYSPYERLRNVASSQKIRLQFRKLVEQFLEYARRRSKQKHDECYVVISIDDLDMAHYNVQSGQKQYANNKSFEIVNCIHKYLSIPGVIVLTAYNHVNLMQQCTLFFETSDLNKRLSAEEMRSQRHTSVLLANQFMDKAFPVNYRNYMPSWKKGDYTEERFQIDIRTGMPDNSIFKKYCDSHREIVTIKELFLILYAEKIGVYYDFEGKKVHFLEPDSLRQLTDMLSLFGSTEDLVEAVDASRPLSCRQAVFKKLKDDLYFRFIQEKLSSPDEKQLFNQWMELRIDRRGEEIVRLVSRDSLPLGKEIKKMMRYYRAEQKARERGYDVISDNVDQWISEEEFERIMDNRNVKYSFAELVHSIFHMTREETEAGSTGYSKELVACILHSYSIYLSQIYDAYREEKQKLLADRKEYIAYYRHGHIIHSNWNESEERGDQERMPYYQTVDQYYEILKGVIGDTICGRWTEYFFPEVSSSFVVDRNTVKTPINLGYMSGVKFLYKATIFWKEEEIKQYLRELVFLAMLHTDVLNWNHITCDIRIASDMVADLQFSREHDDDLELTAFMKYAFLYPEFLTKMEKLLTEAVHRARINNSKSKEWKKQLVELIKEIFDELWDMFYENDRKNGSMMFPIHNFDYAYNLIKHMYRETKDNNEPISILHGLNFFEEFEKLLNLFLEHLRKLDDFYCLKSRSRNFENIFSDNPCIQLFYTLKQNDGSVTRLGMTLINNVILENQNKKTDRFAADEKN